MCSGCHLLQGDVTRAATWWLFTERESHTASFQTFHTACDFWFHLKKKTNQHLAFTFTDDIAGEDPGFPVRGRASTPGWGGGSLTYDFAKFSKKLHEMGGGGGSLHSFKFLNHVRFQQRILRWPIFFLLSPTPALPPWIYYCLDFIVNCQICKHLSQNRCECWMCSLPGTLPWHPKLPVQNSWENTGYLLSFLIKT